MHYEKAIQTCPRSCGEWAEKTDQEPWARSRASLPDSWQLLPRSPCRGWEEGRGWVMWTLSLYGPGPLIATFATLWPLGCAQGMPIIGWY